MRRFFVRELRNAFPAYKLFIIFLVMLCSVTYTMARHNQYILKDPLDLFTLILEGVFSVVFVLLAIFIYLLHFSKELKNKFFFYEQIRIPVRKLIGIKFLTMFSATFVLFFIFMIGCFIFCFYIAPALNLIHYQPEQPLVPGTLLAQDVYSRHTFTQLFQYGVLTYGILYSIWVSLHAALFASLGFLLLLLIRNSFVALSLPFLLYMIGAFILPNIDAKLTPYWFINSIFPYGYIQQPIWTAFVPFAGLTILCSLLYLYVYLKVDRLEHVS